ncbi:GrpB family protein [Virgibacillus halodenitrificans]|uniref:GrpB family protein n=1 Tax=Virgibacillus halodenitrificans TaxID=1482 RepID=UPI00045C4946|nr:GrpB family protein [Virgibacillus halodenitrificans]CDQ35304.1 dephospho-CoA kinase/protein folding accessory domain-containing protein [Virgibacillus halodenitrificans]
MEIRLQAYNKNWVQLYKQETLELKSILKDEVVCFEHFGSTSVPGMKAKPVIDMMCLVKNITKIDAFNSTLEAIGYEAAGEWGISGRRLFRKGGENRTHHLHVYQSDHPEIERHLIVRDYLRTHPKEATMYSRLKEKLAQEYNDTRFYSKAKKPFIQELEERALLWAKEN